MGPFFHAHEPEACPFLFARHRIKSLPVVGDRQGDPLAGTIQFDVEPGRVGMFHHVAETFLRDPVETGGHGLRKWSTRGRP